MAARNSFRRIAQQLRSCAQLRTQSSHTHSTSGLLGACERQGVSALRSSRTSRLLRHRTNMMPTLVGRSSRHILMAFRAMHCSIGILGLDDDGT